MKLETESGGTTSDPGHDDIAKALRGLNSDGNSYAILSRSPTDYVQALIEPAGAFSIEYHDPVSDEHFRCAGPLSLERVTEAFQAFRAGGADWKQGLSFTAHALRGRRGCGGGATAILLAAAGASAAVVALL